MLHRSRVSVFHSSRVTVYKGVYCCAYELITGTETARHTDFVLRRLQMLKDKGVQAALVLDGKCPLMKEDAESNHRQKT